MNERSRKVLEQSLLIGGIKCRYGCMYFLAALVLVCVDVTVMSSA